MDWELLKDEKGVTAAPKSPLKMGCHYYLNFSCLPSPPRHTEDAAPQTSLGFPSFSTPTHLFFRFSFGSQCTAGPQRPALLQPPTLNSEKGTGQERRPGRVSRRCLLRSVPVVPLGSCREENAASHHGAAFATLGKCLPGGGGCGGGGRFFQTATVGPRLTEARS